MILKISRKLKGSLFRECRFLKLCLIRWLELTGQLFPEDARGCRMRGALYKLFLKKCGKNFQVGIGVKLECLMNIEVGDDVYIGHGCWINGGKAGVIFGNEVMLGPYVTMVSGNHTIKDGSYRYCSSEGKKITIGDGTWIAAKATVVAGVTIGRSCLIAANAVVCRDVEMNIIVGGVPAKTIGKSEPASLDSEVEVC